MKNKTASKQKKSDNCLDVNPSGYSSLGLNILAQTKSNDFGLNYCQADLFDPLDKKSIKENSFENETSFFKKKFRTGGAKTAFEITYMDLADDKNSRDAVWVINETLNRMVFETGAVDDNHFVQR